MPLLDHFLQFVIELSGYPVLFAVMILLVMYMTIKIMERPDDHEQDRTRRKVLYWVFGLVLVGEGLLNLSWVRFGWVLLVEVVLLGMGTTSGFVVSRNKNDVRYLLVLLLLCWVGSTELGKFYQKAELPSNTLEQVVEQWGVPGWKKTAASTSNTEQTDQTVPPSQQMQVVKKPSATRHTAKKAAKKAAHKKKEGE